MHCEILTDLHPYRVAITHKSNVCVRAPSLVRCEEKSGQGVGFIFSWHGSATRCELQPVEDRINPPHG